MQGRNQEESFAERAGWAHFDHDADIGVEGIGSTLADAFEQAALATTAVVTTAEVHPSSVISIQCQAPDIELLFVDWLNALVFEMATRQMLFSQFEVTLDHDAGWYLQAQVRGEPVDRLRHAPTVEIKGATFTELNVWADENEIWHARCILDV